MQIAADVDTHNNLLKGLASSFVKIYDLAAVYTKVSSRIVFLQSTSICLFRDILFTVINKEHMHSRL